MRLRQRRTVTAGEAKARRLLREAKNTIHRLNKHTRRLETKVWKLERALQYAQDQAIPKNDGEVTMDKALRMFRAALQYDPPGDSGPINVDRLHLTDMNITMTSDTIEPFYRPGSIMHVRNQTEVTIEVTGTLAGE